MFWSFVIKEQISRIFEYLCEVTGEAQLAKTSQSGQKTSKPVIFILYSVLKCHSFYNIK